MINFYQFLEAQVQPQPQPQPQGNKIIPRRKLTPHYYLMIP